MEINYIILAHKNPKQLRQLVEKLSTPSTFFYIHVDRDVEINPFIAELSGQTSVSFLTAREKGIWGDIGIVKATINALKEVTKKPGKGYCVLISGQDYPIKPNEQIASFLNKNYGVNFIDTLSFKQSAWPNDGLDRIEHYKFNLSAARGHFILLPSVLSKDFYKDWNLNIRSVFQLIKHKKIPFVILKKRSFPKSMIPFAGSQWWAVPIETAKKMLFFLEENKSYLHYHTYSLLPDEFFFQSIVKYLASTDENLVIKPSITYVNWKREGVPLPVTFTSEDIQELLQQPDYKLIARKFELDASDGIFDLLHERNQ
jgi:hypothetical protein